MGKRDEHRDTTEAAILAAALNLLAKGGGEALTVRGLARELSLVPSALYRYVHSREDLLRLLMAHAYSDLADTVEAAHDQVPASDLVGRWRAFAHALRAWSLAHPHEWALINGTPHRQFQPPADESFAPAIRLHLLLVRMGADLEASGVFPVVSGDTERPAMPGLSAITSLTGREISEQTALAGMAAWHLLAGALYSEQFHQVGSDLVDYDLYYEAMVSATERLLLGTASDR